MLSFFFFSVWTSYASPLWFTKRLHWPFITLNSLNCLLKKKYLFFYFTDAQNARALWRAESDWRSLLSELQYEHEQFFFIGNGETQVQY